MPSANYMVEEYQGVVIFRILKDRLLEVAAINDVAAGLTGQVNRHERISLVIDAQAVTHMSSAMLGKFVAVQKMVKKSKGRLALSGLSKSIMPLFEVTKLTKVFTIAATPDQIIKEYTRRPLK
jgi:anti-anti-sigma factor